MLTRVRRRLPSASLADALTYEAGWLLSGTVAMTLMRLRRFHPERVPATGPCLLAANHQSYLDPPCIGACISQRPLHFVARFGLFSQPAFGGVLRRVNSIPIKEEEGDAAAIRQVLARLREGAAVLIFPEGSRSEDGEMSVFKRGASVIVKRAKCPVVPVAIDGGFRAWPRSRRLPRPWGGRVGVLFGEPIAPAELMRDGPDAAMRRLESEVRALREDLKRRLRAASGRGEKAQDRFEGVEGVGEG